MPLTFTMTGSIVAFDGVLDDGLATTAGPSGVAQARAEGHPLDEPGQIIHLAQ
jgi:hypothetical protein